MKKIIVLYSCIALLIDTSCKHKKNHPAEDATFAITTPLEIDTTIHQDFVCQIRSFQHIELRSMEEGYLQSIYVDEGQFVKKGQMLFQLMPLIKKAEVHKAQAELTFATIEYLNTKKLSDSNIVSQAELALGKARLDKAKAELQIAEAHLGFTKISAPFDGIVGRFKEARLGSLVEVGELLTTLSDNSKMWVYFNVPETQYLDYIYNASIEKMPKVQLQLSNNKLFENEGIIETIEADFNNENGNIAFRATFLNPKGILRHGETGNVIMPTTLKNGLIIPQKATYEVLDKKFVFVVNEEQIVAARQITVGHEMPHLYTVVEGLKAGEQILVEGLRKVKNKQKIKCKLIDNRQIANELNTLHAE